MNNKILIFGPNGYLGHHFVDFYRAQNWEVIPDTSDICNIGEIRDTLERHRPDVVLNAAGKTGKPNVDWCESHPGETMSVNVSGAINVATACQELGIYMAHIGSGCIFQGTNEGRGFSEKDAPNFFGSLYSRSKALSEQALKDFGVLQFRIRMPIQSTSAPRNFIDKMVNYDKIISVENSFTIIEDFLPAAFELINRREKGIFNMTNVGSMDHEYLMTQYKEIVDPDYSFTTMSLEEMNSIVKAERSNTILDTSKREALGVHMPEIKERVKEVLAEYKKTAKLAVGS